MNVILQLIVAAMAVAILIRSVMTINRMTEKTNHLIRLAFILIAIGSLSEVGYVLTGHVPHLHESALVCGFGLLNLVERRSLARERLEDL